MRSHFYYNKDFSKRAQSTIAHGALTNSKRPESFVNGIYPTHFKSGYGSILTDVDGNKYVDYICSLGAILLGHRNPRITKSVIDQIEGKGTIFSLGSDLEVCVAEKFNNLFPFLEKLRFLKTSSEACSAAIRIARCFTGKLDIFCDGYSGWHDAFVSLTPPANGVPPHQHMHKLTDVANIPDGTAAVIVEPVITDCSENRIAWLKLLRAKTEAIGALLIFDETITGLRYPELSVAGATGIKPDLAILGKSIAGGFPLSLVGGRCDVMSCDYFVSSTFAGDCVALAAANAVLDIVVTPDVMTDLHLKASAFCKSFNDTCGGVVSIEGYGTRGVLNGEPLKKALFMQECVKAGILFGPSFFYGTTHHEYDDEVLSVCKSVSKRIKNNEVRLEGQLPITPFAQKVRETKT